MTLVERQGAIGAWGERTWGLLMAGVGGFNLFDGVVDHKLLRLHQVRQDVPDLLPYDTGWIAVSLLPVAGLAVARQRDRCRSGR